MTRKPKESVTGYGNLQRLAESIDRQIDALERRQAKGGERVDLFAKLHDLTRSAALLQAEMRKSTADAAKATKNMPLEQQFEIVMKNIVAKWPPDLRRAARLFLEELGDKL